MSLDARVDVIETFRRRIQANDRLRLSKADLEILIASFVEHLGKTEAREDIQLLCETEIQLLEEGYPQASVAKYLTRYRKAIVAAIDAGSLPINESNSHRFIHQQRLTGLREERLEHWALTYLKYTAEIYERIDKRSQRVNRDKQLNLRLVPVNRYLELLRSFLTQKGPFEARWLATAIAGSTGRRFAEVMAKGNFSATKHPYLLRFEGQLKTRSERQLGYDIVTLFPAAEVLALIQRLRELPEVRAIADLEGPDLSAALNVFNQKLNTICGKALCGVVPPMEGKTTVSIHNLRSLYGAIAVYFFCPALQHEYAFVQHFLGHVMDSPATGHYFRFALCDEQENLIRDKGILLGQVEPLPLSTLSSSDPMPANVDPVEFESIEFEPLDPETADPESVDPEMMIASLNHTKQNPLGHEVTCNNTPERTDGLMMPINLQAFRAEWTQDLAVGIARLKDEFEEQLQAVQQDANASWFLQRIGTLERENLKLKEARDLAIKRSQGRTAQAETSAQELAQLKAANQALMLKLQKAKTQLEDVRQLLNN